MNTLPSRTVRTMNESQVGVARAVASGGALIYCDVLNFGYSGPQVGSPTAAHWTSIIPSMTVPVMGLSTIFISVEMKYDLIIAAGAGAVETLVKERLGIQMNPTAKDHDISDISQYAVRTFRSYADRSSIISVQGSLTLSTVTSSSANFSITPDPFVAVGSGSGYTTGVLSTSPTDVAGSIAKAYVQVIVGPYTEAGCWDWVAQPT